MRPSREAGLVVREWAGLEKLRSYGDLLAHHKTEKGLGMGNASDLANQHTRPYLESQY